MQAFSCLLKVLRTMFIHITSPKQGGYQSLECGALCHVKLYKHWIL